MKIVAGLGNPGAQYADTPHSVGFETMDRLFPSRRYAAMMSVTPVSVNQAQPFP